MKPALCRWPALLLGAHVVQALGLMTRYFITPHHEKVFSVCEQHPHNYLDNALDLANLSFIYHADDSLQVRGTIECVAHFAPTEKIVFDIQVFKKLRGQWTPTPYSIHRSDMCHALYSPLEVWYVWTKEIAPDKRECPPPYGIVYDIDELANAKVELPDRSLDGDYKIQVMVTHGPAPQDFLCANILVRLDKE